ncbi:hypothetical protein [Micrococcus luteus]|uniref:hypothetical protein n=1 Tax=Micrococcus luteus TaxID=1270 RepID=UPI003321A8DC
MNTADAVPEGFDPVKNTPFGAHPLTPTLALAVPLEIARLAALKPYQRGILFDAVLTDYGYSAAGRHWSRDDILFKGRHSGEGFAELTRVLACFAWQPGGFTALGLHACARPHPSCLAPAARPGGCCVCGADCTTAQADGACPQQGCAWCANGCECCSHPSPFGRIVLLREATS